MSDAIDLAERGRGSTLSNPLVGALIVDKNGRVVGSGYHEAFGAAHAEINAINSANCDLSDKVLVCTLEPCDHTGKTGPCTEAIINSGIKKVVIGARDPNPKVNGRGVNRLSQSGIDVSFGVESNRILRQNEAYVKLIQTGMPLVTMKISMTKEGKITDYAGQPAKITRRDADRFVHEMRSKADGIITGIGTVLSDDPLLTARLVKSKRQPARFIFDTAARLPLDSRMVKTAGEVETFLLVGEKADKARLEGLTGAGVKVVETECDEAGLSIEQALGRIAKLGYINLMLEAGHKISSSFIKQGFVDKVEVLKSQRSFGRNGLPAFDSEANEIFNSNLVIEKERMLGADKHISGRMKNVHRLG